MKNKKIILLSLSFLSVCFLVAMKYTDHIVTFRKFLNGQWLEIFFNALIFTLFIFFFSLLTYKLPQAVFEYWWKFARFAIPFVFALVILINLRLHHSPGGWMNLDNEIDIVLVSVLYGLFSLGSVIQIVRGFYGKGR